MVKKKFRNFLIWVILIFAILFVLVLSLRAQENKQACLSLSFDDGLKSHYTVVYPLLKEKNYSATFFVIANVSDHGGQELMTKQEVQELVDYGFEIGSHTLTHPFLTILSEEEVDRELKDSKKKLERDYGVVIDTIAIPYGMSNENVLNIAKKYYITARAVFNQRPIGFLLTSFGLTKDTDPEEVCALIVEAKENDLWLILVLHDVSEEPGLWDTSINDFSRILECSEEVEIYVDSIRGCRESLS